MFNRIPFLVTLAMLSFERKIVFGLPAGSKDLEVVEPGTGITESFTSTFEEHVQLGAKEHAQELEGSPIIVEPSMGITESSSFEEHVQLGAEEDTRELEGIPIMAEQDLESSIVAANTSEESLVMSDDEETPSFLSGIEFPALKVAKFELPSFPELKLMPLAPLPEFKFPDLAITKCELPSLSMLPPMELPPLPDFALPDFSIEKFELPSLPNLAFPDLPKL